MSQQVTNLVADGSTTAISARGEVIVVANGTWGSGTLTLEGQDPADAWHALTTGITADGYISIRLPDRELLDIRATLASSTSPDLDVWIIADEVYG